MSAIQKVVTQSVIETHIICDFCNGEIERNGTLRKEDLISLTILHPWKEGKLSQESFDWCCHVCFIAWVDIHQEEYPFVIRKKD
jgi:hypothetical protein